MRITFEIETHDSKLLSDLFELKEREWMPRVFEEGASARYGGSVERLTKELPEIIIIAVEILKAIGIGVLSAWLYDKIKGRAVTLRIKKTEVKIDKGEIERILIEEMEKEE